jgi:alanyl-tRNA synthetase
MKGEEIRKRFVEFFVERGHTHVAAAPLVPPDDPTLLFTSAGMVQFKPLWSGAVELPYRRATTVQKCLRTGDLENVGLTLRHLTFFEMLGNFSFGDYFKREAIIWAWEFVTQVLNVPSGRLYVSVFRDDNEAYEIWHNEVGLSKDRIVRLGEDDNFWGPAGDTGACGPCSEIYFDMGAEFSCGKPTCAVGCDCERYLEFWNLVFPQFDQQKDGSRLPLKNRGIDTGLGMERIACIMQKTSSLFETDLLYPIVEAAADAIGVRYTDSHDTRMSLNVIADHVRALTFVLSEGVVPSNEGRGYVMRRILRRAARHGKKIGMDKPFLFSLIDVVIETIGKAYPEIAEHPQQVRKVVQMEEERFHRTLTQGIELLETIISDLQARHETVLPGDEVFKLYDTYGFPLDLTHEVATEKGLRVDKEGFEACLAEQQNRARAAWKGAALETEAELTEDIFAQHGATAFLGYESFSASSTILAILKDGKRVEGIGAGDEALLVLKKTPFYAEAGGQVGDTGLITSGHSRFDVLDTQKTPEGIHLHKGKVIEGTFRVGDTAEAAVDEPRRLAIMRNHTATHLLQGALKRIIGKHITQSGSNVSPSSLRFDFTHLEPLTPEQLHAVEAMVNEQIMTNRPVAARVLPLEEAKRLGAIAPFGEKYGETVRVMEVKDFSREFCGGTHLSATGQIGSFVIVSESSIASGIRRIEALTGTGAFEYLSRQRALLTQLSQTLSASKDDLAQRVEQLVAELKLLRREVQQLRQEKSHAEIDEILGTAQTVEGVKILTHIADNLEANELRNLVDLLRAREPQAVIGVGSSKGGKATLICAVPSQLAKQMPANKIVKAIAPIIAGGGGGRAEMAQAGGKNPEKLGEALRQIAPTVATLLKKKA